MAVQPIPLTVIGGFLGAGKTTLLNYWLRASRDVRMAVLVNDFGAINLDAGLVESRSGDTIALSNGCVCCQIGNDLAQAFIRVLDAQPAFDAIVIEASGVSDPWRIAELGQAVPELRLDGVIVLVDARAFAQQVDDPLLTDTIQRQLASADLIVANHCDQASVQQLDAAHEALARIAPGVPIHETSHGVVPLAMLTSLALPAVGPGSRQQPAADAPALQPPDHDHVHDGPGHGALFDSWSSLPQADFDPQQLRSWLDQLPAGILRLKGFVKTAAAGVHPDWVELQVVGKHATIRAVEQPESGAQLVAIGLKDQLPVEELRAQFEPIGS